MMKVAIAYDFDGTLSPANMQQHSFLPALGIAPEDFWAEVGELTRKNDMSGVLAYMFLMLKKAEAGEIKITREAFKSHGHGLKFYPGVLEYFSKINQFAESRGLEIEHYIISSGQRDILEGSAIFDEFEEVFASRYLYDANDVAVWPALAVDYTNKMQFLFRINKGIKNSWDSDELNAYTPQENRPIPFERMIYIGDGSTDVPALKTTKMQGGKSIVVYDGGLKAERLSRAKNDAEKLVEYGRADFALPADYREASELFKTIQASLEQMAD